MIISILFDHSNKQVGIKDIFASVLLPVPNGPVAPLVVLLAPGQHLHLLVTVNQEPGQVCYSLAVGVDGEEKETHPAEILTAGWLKKQKVQLLHGDFLLDSTGVKLVHHLLPLHVRAHACLAHEDERKPFHPHVHTPAST